MEQLIEAFGIDIKLIVIQIINFAVLAGLLSYFLYKPVLKVLQDREDKIKEGIRDAEEAAKAKGSALEEKRTLLSQAQKDAEAIGANAMAFGKEKETELLKEAQTKADEVINDAQQKSILLKEQALKESESEIAQLAILAAAKVLEHKHQ
jgi:F-type H+-transporting ATPase subunit b